MHRVRPDFKGTSQRRGGGCWPIPSPIISKMIGFISTAKRAMPDMECLVFVKDEEMKLLTSINNKLGNDFNIVSRSWLL